MNKNIVSVVVGFFLGVAVLSVLGSAGSSSPSGDIILVATSDGGAYYYDGDKLYRVTGTTRTPVAAPGRTF